MAAAEADGNAAVADAEAVDDYIDDVYGEDGDYDTWQSAVTDAESAYETAASSAWSGLQKSLTAHDAALESALADTYAKAMEDLADDFPGNPWAARAAADARAESDKIAADQSAESGGWPCSTAAPNHRVPLLACQAVPNANRPPTPCRSAPVLTGSSRLCCRGSSLLASALLASMQWHTPGKQAFARVWATDELLGLIWSGVWGVSCESTENAYTGAAILYSWEAYPLPPRPDRPMELQPAHRKKVKHYDIPGDSHLLNVQEPVIQVDS